MSSAHQSPDNYLLSAGELIDGRYEVVDVLGQGGFATVYSARQTHVDRMVAIKVLDVLKMLTPQGMKEFRERFTYEAKAAAKVQHANIVTIHDFGFIGAEQRPYIAMEMLEGHDLEVEVQDFGPMHPARAVRLMARVLGGLGVAHDEGIVHRDLKPANLYLNNPGQDHEALMIVDFGIARIDEPAAPQAGGVRLTAPGEIIGTPGFLAPEFIRFQRTSPALDVYQMGLILVEMITGDAACPVDDPYEAMQIHCEGLLHIPKWLRKSALGPILDNALHLDDSLRYQDAKAFQRALEEIEPKVASLKVPADVKSRSQRVVRETVVKKTGRVLALVLILALVLGAVLFLVIKPGDDVIEAEAQAATESGETRSPDDSPGDAGGSPEIGATASAGDGDEPETNVDPEVAAAEAMSEAVASARNVVGDALTVASLETLKAASAEPAGGDGAPALVTVSVKTKPKGAKVEMGGESIGKTPVELELQATTQPTSLTLSKRGFKTLRVEFVPSAGLEIERTLRKKAERTKDKPDTKTDRKNGGGGGTMVIP